MSEETGQRPTNNMTDKQIAEEIARLKKFEAHISELAHRRLKALVREQNYRKTKSGAYI